MTATQYSATYVPKSVTVMRNVLVLEDTRRSGTDEGTRVVLVRNWTYYTTCYHGGR
jgi:hypothetical protein